jgi:MFS family permease
MSFGAFWGVWVVVFPDFLVAHSLSLSEISWGFTGMSVVAIGFMSLVAPRLEGLPRRLTIGGALLLDALGNVVLALSGGAGLVVAFALMGAGTGSIDVFVNAAGSEIERRSRRPTLQWIHAAYGAGGVVGSLGAAAVLVAGGEFRVALLAAAVLQSGAAAWCFGSARLGATDNEPRTAARFSLGVVRRLPFLLAPALVVLCAFFIEGSMDVWSVIFVRRTLGSTILAGAVAFAAFAAAITIGRTVSARVLFGLGQKRTVLLSGIGSLVCTSIAVLTSSPVVAGVAFLCLGFTLSAASPAGFGMTERARSDAGHAVAAVTTIGYTGFVFGPPLMGWLGDHAGLRAALTALVVAAAGIALGGVMFRPPDRLSG